MNRQGTNQNSRHEQTQNANQGRIYLNAALAGLLLFVSLAASFVLLRSPETLTVTIGNPSPRSFRAPYSIVYASDIRTEQARVNAEEQVDSIFTEADPRIGEEQLANLRNASVYIESIIHSTGNREEKIRLLSEMPDAELSMTVTSRIVELTKEEWNRSSDEALRVLDIVMRDQITSEKTGEAAEKALRMITRDVSLEQNSIIYELVSTYIKPNSFLDVEATLAAREQARDLVDNVQVNIRDGEVLVYEGEIVDALTAEALQQYGVLQKPETTWENIVSGIAYAFILVALVSAYILAVRADMIRRPRRLWLFALVLGAYSLVVRLMVPGHVLLPYLVPYAFVSIVLTILLDREMGMLAAIIAGAILSFSPGTSLELVAFAVFSSIVASLGVRRIESVAAFAKTAFYVFSSNAATVLIFRLNSGAYDTTGLLELLAASAGNAAICASLAFVAFAIIGRLFGITTFLQLLELARPTHPLMRQLSLKAPGTYHHSLIVANMAERAAQAVGADPLLARVGAYYHDIGKLNRPNFFAENQSDGNNPHDKLDPLTSAKIIISHVTDGLTLARQYRLPERISAFIGEHHGTTFASFFYHTARKQNPDNEIPTDDFCYPGPRPRSRETAIVMLADSIEAAVRAKRPESARETHKLVKHIIQSRVADGQLAECALTLSDLTLLQQAFEDVLRGVFHPRVTYPEAETENA